MLKLSLNLPKYRLHLNLKMIKRRKGFVEEAILPEIEGIKKAKKENKKSKISFLFRYIFEHKNIKKFLGANLALILLLTSFIPKSTLAGDEGENTIIAEQTVHTTTEKSSQYPLKTIKINQYFHFFHPGIDLDGELGDPIYPIKKGKVQAISNSRFAYGNAVLIDHGNKISSLYAHLSEIDVYPGQEVSTDTIIGKVGSTGYSTGSHLHLEVHDHGIPINPLSVLPLP
jgi:murein DD-endopeptidase MepM/ murein hydrolase activator NlpD